MSNRFEIGSRFEAEVRLVARALWDARPGDGAPEMFAGRERDCIFHAEDVSHYIECTTSTKLDKLKMDLAKLLDYRKQRASQGKLVKLWMITEKEPTADQKTYARQNSVEMLSLREFRRRIVDGPKYVLPLKLTDGTQLSLVDGHRGACADRVAVEMAIVERARRAPRRDGYRPGPRTPAA